MFNWAHELELPDPIDPLAPINCLVLGTVTLTADVDRKLVVVKVGDKSVEIAASESMDVAFGLVRVAKATGFEEPQPDPITKPKKPKKRRQNKPGKPSFKVVGGKKAPS